MSNSIEDWRKQHTLLKQVRPSSPRCLPVLGCLTISPQPRACRHLSLDCCPSSTSSPSLNASRLLTTVRLILGARAAWRYVWSCLPPRRPSASICLVPGFAWRHRPTARVGGRQASRRCGLVMDLVVMGRTWSGSEELNPRVRSGQGHQGGASSGEALPVQAVIACVLWPFSRRRASRTSPQAGGSARACSSYASDASENTEDNGEKASLCCAEACP